MESLVRISRHRLQTGAVQDLALPKARPKQTYDFTPFVVAQAVCCP